MPTFRSTDFIESHSMYYAGTVMKQPVALVGVIVAALALLASVAGQPGPGADGDKAG